MLFGGCVLFVNGLFLMLRLSTGSFPKPLTKAEEAALVEAMAAGDRQAREKLINHNLRLVAHIIKKYYARSADQDDLVSIGTIGLIKGISSYRPEKGSKLSTYAARCIENEILMYFRSRKKLGQEVSLSDSIDADNENGGLSLMDVLRVEDTMLEDIARDQTAVQLRRCVETDLEEREKTVLRLRYGLDGKTPMTQRDTAQTLGISRSYVSRIEKRAIEKLRKRLKNAE